MEGSNGRVHKPRLLKIAGDDINPRLFVGGEWAHHDNMSLGDYRFQVSDA